MKKQIFTGSHFSNDILNQYGVPTPTPQEVLKATYFQKFVDQAEQKYNYNPETDTIDIKKVFEDLVWPTIKDSCE